VRQVGQLPRKIAFVNHNAGNIYLFIYIT